LLFKSLAFSALTFKDIFHKKKEKKDAMLTHVKYSKGHRLKQVGQKPIKQKFNKICKKLKTIRYRMFSDYGIRENTKQDIISLDQSLGMSEKMATNGI